VPDPSDYADLTRSAPHHHLTDYADLKRSAPHQVRATSSPGAIN
jgi:hypothetical protein